MKLFDLAFSKDHMSLNNGIVLEKMELFGSVGHVFLRRVEKPGSGGAIELDRY
jgi:hypothetical protein